MTNLATLWQTGLAPTQIGLGNDGSANEGHSSAAVARRVNRPLPATRFSFAYPIPAHGKRPPPDQSRVLDTRPTTTTHTVQGARPKGWIRRGREEHEARRWLS